MRGIKKLEGPGYYFEKPIIDIGLDLQFNTFSIIHMPFIVLATVC
jgi:hypothetical protein